MLADKIFENTEDFSAFPNTDLVLNSDLEKKHLLPFGFLRLKIENETYEILLAGPIGDDEGIIGNVSDSDRIGDLWISYSLNSSSMWEINASDNELRFDAERSESARNVYKKRECFFEKNGYIGIEDDERREKFCLFNTSRKIDNYSNLFASVSDTLRYELVSFPEGNSRKKLVNFLDKDGNRFIYLGEINGVNYSDSYMPNFNFFFCVKENRVLVISEYS